MLKFAAEVFKGFVNVLLWLVLIVFVICGFVIGGNIGGIGFSFGYAILGLIIGGIIGIITIILSGGLIANFLNMVDDIYTIKNHLLKNTSTSNTNSSGINLSDVSQSRPNQVNFGDTWECKKCGEKNPVTSSSCKDCGAYK
jgi:hypothetical protein